MDYDITDEQIEQLKQGAEQTGDGELVEVCEIAMGIGVNGAPASPGWKRDAREECAKLIANVAVGS